MSWKVQVKTPGDTDWVDNQVRLATEEEAQVYKMRLFTAWSLVKDIQVLQCDDPVNYRVDDQGHLEPWGKVL